MRKHQRFSSHQLYDLNDASFSPVEYSKLKFGSDTIAQKYGYELARDFFRAHADAVIANKCVVIASPYNYVPNAATIMSRHFIDKLNELSVNAVGRPVESTLIHRKVSYINDYGFLSKEKRRGLIDNDSFYLNRDFVDGKLLLFIDDVRITGTHEDKLVEVLDRDKISNDAFFLYYAQYDGNRPDIEAELNFAAIRNIDDYVNLSHFDDSHVIIRPIKYLLTQKGDSLQRALTSMKDRVIKEMYHGCLAEGYYKIPAYQHSFAALVAEYKRRIG